MPTWTDTTNTVPDFASLVYGSTGSSTGGTDTVPDALIQALQALQAAGEKFTNTPDGTLVDSKGRVYSGVQLGSNNSFIVNGQVYAPQGAPAQTVTPAVEGSLGTYTGPNPNNRNVQSYMAPNGSGGYTLVNDAALEASAIGRTLSGADVTEAAQAGWNLTTVNVPGFGPMSFLAPAGSRFYIDPTRTYGDAISAREAVQIVAPDSAQADAFFNFASQNPQSLTLLQATNSVPASQVDQSAALAATPRQAYAKLPNGQTDYTKYADGTLTGLDARGQPPYMADGTPNPNYTGPTPGPASQYDPRGYLQPGQTPPPAPAGYGDKPTDAELQAIRERATAAGKKPTDQDVLDTWNANKAKQIVSQYGDNPTQAELDAIKQRAIAAGKKPTDASVLATWQSNKNKYGVVTQAPAEQPTTTTLTTGPGPETITPVTIAPAKGQTSYTSPAGTSTTTDRSSPGKQLAADPVVSLAVNGGQAAIDAYRASTSKGEAVTQTGSSNPFGYTQEQLDEFKKKFG